MSALEAYKEYIAIKNHFSKPEYDYFKYNGKSRINPKTFDSRKDKLYFQKLAKHQDVKSFLVANFIVNEKMWIKEIAYSDEAENNYKEWNKRQQSLSYFFRQDLSKLDSNFNDNFVCKDNEHPILLKKFLRNEISLDTLCLLLDMTKAKKHWDSRMKNDFVWETVRTKIEKYTPFIKVDKEKIKKITLDFFS
jgi:hypothetical protein